MDIKKILELWEEDSKISGTSLDEDSRKTPQLHAKYLGYLAEKTDVLVKWASAAKMMGTKIDGDILSQDNNDIHNNGGRESKDANKDNRTASSNCDRHRRK